MYVYSIIMLVNLAALHVMVSLHGSRQNQANHNVYIYCMKAVSFIMNKLRYGYRVTPTIPTWTATTDSTSTEILLNSSKHPQAPVWARPL